MTRHEQIVAVYWRLAHGLACRTLLAPGRRLKFWLTTFFSPQTDPTVHSGLPDVVISRSPPDF
jgi:hypothetical protein